jgi:cyanophycin synthetase
MEGQQVILNDKVSRKHGTVIEDVTDHIHPENIALFEHIARELGDPLIGMDFMIGDMRKSWKEQPGAGVIECNAMPYIDLHLYPYSGKSRNVAGDLWRYVFTHSS